MWLYSRQERFCTDRFIYRYFRVSLHHISAAAVPLAALTAWESLFDKSLYGRCGGGRDRRRHRGGSQAADFRLRRRSLARGHHCQPAYTSGLLRRSAPPSGPRPRRVGTRPPQSEVRSPLEEELISAAPLMINKPLAPTSTSS